MDPAKWQKIKDLVAAVLELPDSDRRAALAREPDEQIRHDASKLVYSHELAGDFIDKPILIDREDEESSDEYVGKNVENYKILERIGTGGMGTVYLAERLNSDFKQKVAIKLIKRGMDSEALLKRFERERRILSSLRHPNIAQLLDGGISSDGLPYFVMEYVEGKPLNQFCREHGLNLDERLKIIRQICEAVEHAHKNLVIHRDLKPSNIIVTDEMVPKLLDFGIAKLLTDDESESTNTANLGRLFTPEYASPEQILGNKVTTATDVYSLGVILYELLTRHRPFDLKEKSYEEVVENVCRTEPTRPSETFLKNVITKEFEQPDEQVSQHQLRGDLDNIVLKALRKEPSERYGSVHQLSEDIRRYLSGLPVLARPQTAFYRFGKYFRRHKLGVAAAALILLSLFTGVSVATWQAVVAGRERAKAEQRFNELRDVAKSLMIDTSTALDQIPESLEIRKSLLEKSVAVLNSLARDKTADPEFMNELADGYDKLGRIRNWSLRETDLALGDFQKALDLREKSLTLAPDKVKVWQKIAVTLEYIIEIYAINGDSAKVVELGEKARNALLEANKLEPANQSNFGTLSSISERSAENLKNAGRDVESAEKSRESIEYIDRAIELQKTKLNGLDDQVSLVGFQMQKGLLLENFERYDEALELYGQAAKLAEKVYRTDHSKMYAFNHTSRIHRLIGDIYAKRGDWPAALKNYEFSLNWLLQNRNNNKLDQRNMSFGIAVHTVRVGRALDKTGQKKAGTAKVEEGLSLYRDYLKPHENDASAIIFAPDILEIASVFYAETSQTQKQLKLWDEFILRVEKFLVKNPGDSGILNFLSYALRKKGDALSGSQKNSLTLTMKSRENLRLAKATYIQSLAVLSKSGRLETRDAEAKKLEKELEEKIKNCG